LIVLDGVSFRYPSSSSWVLQDISVSIKDGEWVSVVGGNASGKSTLSRVIAGLIEPERGTVLIDGLPASRALRDFSGAPPFAVAFQNPDGYFVTASVSDEITFGLENIGLSDVDIRKKYEEAVELFGLADVVSRNPHVLSGGEKQRLALATAWVLDARCVILDEPLSFLDSGGAHRFLRSLEGAFRSKETTVIWMALNEKEFPMSDRVFYLQDGKLVEHTDRGSSTKEVQHGTREAETRIVRKGRSNTGAETALMVEDALFSYTDGGFKLFVPSLELSTGECLGVSGKNGSGKSTLLLGCSGLLPPSAGTVRLMGRKIRDRMDFPYGDVGFVFQIPEQSFFKPTVYEEVSFGLTGRNLSGSIESAVKRALSATGLDPEKYLSRNPYSLSQSERRLVAVASILALDAMLYFFDEPLIFLDRDARVRMIELIKELKRNGKGVVVASHDIAFLRNVTDRVVTCAGGRVE